MEEFFKCFKEASAKIVQEFKVAQKPEKDPNIGASKSAQMRFPLAWC